MNYKNINAAIIKGHDMQENFSRDKDFYNYLLGNNVVYFYSSILSTKKTQVDKKILKAGKILNDKYLKTLHLISKIGKENKISFLLFKTYKYIPEIVDNDIDLFVRERDFSRFMKALEEEGFDCIENERLKGICTKESFCNIEPRVNLEFHELVILDEEKIWNKREIVKVSGITISKVIKEIDLLHPLLSILYNPNYLKLYVFLVYKNTEIKELFNLVDNVKINQDLAFVIKKLITGNVEDKRFPLFMGSKDYVSWWFKRILPEMRLSIYTRLKHILFFFYMKYSQILFNRLIFKHDWPLE